MSAPCAVPAVFSTPQGVRRELHRALTRLVGGALDRVALQGSNGVLTPEAMANELLPPVIRALYRAATGKPCPDFGLNADQYAAVGAAIETLEVEAGLRQSVDEC